MVVGFQRVLIHSEGCGSEEKKCDQKLFYRFRNMALDGR